MAIVRRERPAARSATAATRADRPFDDRVATRCRRRVRGPSRIPVRILVAEDRRDDDVLVRTGSRSSSQSAACRCVSAVATLAATKLEPAREPHVDLGGHRPTRAPPLLLPVPRPPHVVTGTSAANSSSGSTTIAPGPATASFSAAIASASPPGPACARDRRSSAARPGVERRSSRRAARRGPPRAPRRRPAAGELEQRGAVSVSNCVAPSRSGCRPHARDRALEAGRRRSRAARPSRRRAATCRRRRASPSARSSAAIVRVVVDLPFVPTTWIAR